MTLTEFRNLIRETKNPIWFNNEVLNLKVPAVGLDLKFDGFSSAYKFLLKQEEDWNNLGKLLPNELEESKRHFRQLKSSLETFVLNNKLQENESTLNQQKRNLNNNFEKSFATIFTADAPETAFLMRIFKNNPHEVANAFNYLTGQAAQNLHLNSGFSGFLKGYEYATKNSEITERKTNEKASLTKLKNEFLNNLPQLEKQLNDHLVNSDIKFKNYSEALDKFQLDKEKSISDWLINSKGSFEKLEKESNSKILSLEKTYQEKLKLEAPARYWKTKSDKFYKEGKNARTILISIIISSAAVIAILLFTSPEWIFQNVFQGNTTAIIRWSLLLITFLSLIAYAIKALSKVMFSSYHLARDAEERHTLTFFYLALLKESDLKDEERIMVIQSLFSRVDTGLLKDDSGPVMPNDLSKFFNK